MKIKMLMMVGMLGILTGCAKQNTEATTAAAGTEQVTEATLPDTVAEVTTEALLPSEQPEWQAEYLQNQRLERYAAVVQDVVDGIMPDGWQMEIYEDRDERELAECLKYAVCDINSDGVEELLIKAEEPYGLTSVCSYDPNTGELKQIFTGNDWIDYYSNGILLMYEKHPGSVSEDLQPYGLYQYDPNTALYKCLGYAGVWDKSLQETDYDGNAFPDWKDYDEDGVVYTVDDPYGNPLIATWTRAEYDAWIQSYIAGATKLEPAWEVCQYEFGEEYRKKNNAMFYQQYQDRVARLGLDVGTDLGSIFLNPDCADWEDQISALIKSQNPGESIADGEVEGGYDEDASFVRFYDSQGYVMQNERIGNYTLCGIYPGMDVQTAIQILSSVGFHSSYTNIDDYGFCVGYSVSYRNISIMSENGVVKQIWFGETISY